MPEQPLYIAYQDIRRVLFPKLIQMVALGALFYFGVWLNLYLLRVRSKTLVSIIAITGITILVILELWLVARKIKAHGYLFYPNKMEYKNKSVFYGNIKNIYMKKDFFDKLLGTGTINLYPYLKIEKVKNSEQIYSYVQRLVQTRPVY